MLELQSLQVLTTANCGWLWMIPGAALLGALVNGFLFFRSPEKDRGKLPGVIAFTAAGLSLFLAFLAFIDFKNLPDNTVLFENLLNWMDISHLRFAVGIQLDDLALTLVLFIAWIGFWIHLYAASSSVADPKRGLIFACLNLLLFFLLVLVLADGFLLLFWGWEGAGLCSVFLIGLGGGAARGPARKALLVHRVTDGAFLMGLLTVVALTGTANFNDLQGLRQDFHGGAATLICLCFLAAALGKAAQFPLSGWLVDSTDAPEASAAGSALLQAVVLGASGLYLVARLHFIFVLSPWATTIMALVGAGTALWAAFMSLSGFRLQRILAYTTVSQLGLMFLGMGVSAYAAGLFDLMTHGFFKPVLVLAAGSAIAILGGERDIRRMGGLLKQMPLVSLAFLMAWLAACGLPPFSGFFSDCGILWRALATPNPLLPWAPWLFYGVGLSAVFLTAFALTRLTVLAFLGPEKKHRDRDPRETFPDAPLSATLPLLSLAVVSIGIGWIDLPECIGGGARLNLFLDSTFRLSTLESNGIAAKWEPLLMLVFLIVVLLGMATAWYLYAARRGKKFPEVPDRQAGSGNGLDDFYGKTFGRSARWAAFWICQRLVDEILLQFLVRWAGRCAAKWARGLRRTHIGRAQFYFLYILLGAALLVVFAFH